MVRLKDIAAQAGVSVMTVSKALRGESDIAVATRERVQKIATSLGYVPNPMARALRGRRTRLLGLVIPATTDPVYSRVMMAIEEGAHEMGCDLILGQTLGQAEREEVVLRKMLARRVEGLLISPVPRMETRSAVYEQLAAMEIPVVVLGQRGVFCQNFSNVEADDALGIQAMTRHLIELGHRRIAHFAGPAMAPWARERLEGYKRAHREAGWEVDDRLIFRAGSTVEEGAAAAIQFLAEAPGATAIVAGTDLVAVGASTGLMRQGQRIPEDLSVTGFGNVLVAEHFRVPLTTVRQPKHRLGTVAMGILGRLLEGGARENRVLPAEILYRASTGAPAGAVAVKDEGGEKN